MSLMFFLLIAVDVSICFLCFTFKNMMFDTFPAAGLTP